MGGEKIKESRKGVAWLSSLITFRSSQGGLAGLAEQLKSAVGSNHPKISAAVILNHATSSKMPATVFLCIFLWVD